MKLKEFSPTFVLILLAAILAGTSIYLNTRKKNQANEMKSQLTSPAEDNSESKKPEKLDKLRSMLNKNFLQKKTPTGSPTPLVAQERYYTEKEIRDMNEESFKLLLADIELRLPKISDLKNIPAEALHRTPEPVLEAGKNLGLVKEILNIHESYGKVAAGFYETCAKSNERPTPVRALCLTNLAELKKKSAQRINIKDYPAQVVDLAKMITDL